MSWRQKFFAPELLKVSLISIAGFVKSTVLTVELFLVYIFFHKGAFTDSSPVKPKVSSTVILILAAKSAIIYNLHLMIIHILAATCIPHLYVNVLAVLTITGSASALTGIFQAAFHR